MRHTIKYAGWYARITFCGKSLGPRASEGQGKLCPVCKKKGKGKWTVGPRADGYQAKDKKEQEREPAKDKKAAPADDIPRVAKKPGPVRRKTVFQKAPAKKKAPAKEPTRKPVRFVLI